MLIFHKTGFSCIYTDGLFINCKHSHHVFLLKIHLKKRIFFVDVFICQLLGLFFFVPALLKSSFSAGFNLLCRVLTCHCVISLV